MSLYQEIAELKLTSEGDELKTAFANTGTKVSTDTQAAALITISINWRQSTIKPLT